MDSEGQMIEEQESSAERAISGDGGDQLKFELTVFYNYLFDTGAFINPTEAARTLLEKDFALSSANYSNETIEIANRFKDLKKLRVKGKRILELQTIIKNKNYSNIIDWALKNPYLFVYFLYFMSSNIISSSQKVEESEKIEKDTKEGLEETLDFMDDSIIDIQKIEALHRDADRSLFTPQYIGEIPFSRVSLQPFFATIAEENLGIDVRVLIHRTGIAILTFYILFSKQKSIEELADIRASTPIETIEICKSILDAQEGPISTPTKKRSSGGVEWFTYDRLKDVTLMDIFKIYQSAIISAINKKKLFEQKGSWSWMRSSNTMAYPIYFINRVHPPIFDLTEFKIRYPKELASMILRFPGFSLKEEVVQKIINEDLSIMKQYSLFINSANTICIYYESVTQNLIKEFGEKIPGQQWAYRHFMTSSVIDVLLTQRWTLTVLNDLMLTYPASFKKINRLKKELLLGLDEYYSAIFMHGTAQDLIKVGKEKIGVIDLYQSLLQKINDIDRIVEMEETDRRAKRDLLLKFAATFATVLFGLVGSWQTIGIIIEWNDLLPSVPKGWMKETLAMFIDFVQLHSIAVTLTLYLCSIMVVMTLFIWSFLFPSYGKPIVHRDQSKPAYSPGFEWPVSIKIKHYDSRDSTNNENNKNKN